MKNTSQNTAIGYVRVSTEEQAESGLGLQSQRDRIGAYAALRGFQLLDVIADEGVSGGKPLASRAGGEALLRLLRTRRASAVIMVKLDRGFRNASDCLNTIEQWNRQGVVLHLVDLGGNSIDTASAAGMFMLTVLAGAAAMERNLTRERTKAALAVKASRGERISRFAPYGYDLGPDGVRLVENPAEQVVIEDITRWREQGLSLRAIAGKLNDRGVRSKNGASWHPSVLREVCRRAVRQAA